MPTEPPSSPDAVKGDPRLAALEATALLDTPPEVAFDRITRMVTELLHTPVALVSLVDAQRQFFKSSCGLEDPWASQRQTPLSHSFCQHVAASGAPLVITDAREHPLVHESLAIRDLKVIGYLGMPIKTPTGRTLGSLCAIDHVPRQWTEEEQNRLADLAEVVMSEIEVRVLSRALRESSGDRVHELVWDPEALRAEVSERRRVEAALREGGVCYRLLAEKVSYHALIRLDKKGEVISWNPGAERLFGWKEEEIVGRSFEQLFTPEDRAANASVRQLGEAEKLGRGEDERWRIRRDGTRIFASGAVLPLHDENGQVHSFLAIIRDTTQQKLAERVLRETHLSARRGLKTGPDGRSRLSRYGIAIVAVFVTVVIRAWLGQWLGEHAPLLLFTAAVGFSAWWGGLGPGLLATVLSSAAGSALFIFPWHPLNPFDAAEQVRLAVFLLIGVGSSVTLEVMHRARRRELTVAIRLAAEVEERRRVESAVRESEERFRLLVEGVKDYAIFMLDTEGKVVSWNPGAEHLNGYSAGEVLGRHFSLFYPPEQVTGDGPQRKLEIAAQEGRCEEECLRVRKDGSHFSALVVVTALRDELGQIGGYSEITRDITGWVKTREALRESEARLTQALKAGRLGRWHVDLRSNRAHQDAQAARLLGLMPEQAEMEVEEFRARLHPDDRLYIERAITNAVQGREGYDVEFRVVHSDSKVHWLAAKGDVVRSESGEPSRMTGVVFDITDRKEIETALLEADRRKDQFLAMLGHELRNPLAAIRNALEVGLRAEESQPWALEVIERQSGRLTRMVDALLDTSHIARGKIELHKEQLSFTTVLDHAVETVQPLIEQKKHTLHREYEHSGSGLPVYGDAVRLEQVIVNLLTNAVKYTPPGGEIWLTARRESADQSASVSHTAFGSPDLDPATDVIVISVRDSGVGILPEYIPVMFEIFAQTERDLARSEGGLGLGLSIVRHLVEMHGGTVEGHSEGLGKGSEFIVRLPVSEDAGDSRGGLPMQDAGGKEHALSPKSEPVVTDGTKRVLIVDDNEDAAWGLWKLLKRWGYTVDLAFDGETALEKARALRPDVALLDIGLPGRNGYEVARELHMQEHCRTTRLIAITGYNQEEDRKNSREAGFEHHLAKPVDTSELKRLLEA